MPQHPPLIFLDIDGVICCNFQGNLEEPKLAQLKRVASATGAKVVLSSDWRRKLPLKQKVQRALKRCGIPYVGATPQRVVTETAGNWIYEKPCRPQEIVEWLRQYREGGSTIAWVAVDDRDLLTELGGAELRGHFVQTNFCTGLTHSLADECIGILSESPHPHPSSVVSGSRY